MPNEDLTPLIVKVRELFNEDYENNKELYDDGDVDKVKTDDWYVTRFILRNKKKSDASFEMLKICMRWRKEFGIPYMKETDFPQEFYKIGGCFQYEKDLEGNGMVYLRIKMHKKIAEIEDALKHFIIYIMNRVDVEVDGRGMAIVFDCHDAGIGNMDMDMLWFLIHTLVKYYPKGMAYVLVYELPWILTAAWKIAKKWIPEEQRKLIKFANKNEITNYIALENLPDYMGGLCKRDYRAIPKGCPTAEECARERGVSDRDVERMMKMFEPFLIESDKAIASFAVSS